MIGSLDCALLVLLALVFGGWIGLRIADAHWRLKSAMDDRMLSAKRFFFVVEDGDVGKAEHVLTCCRIEKQKKP